MDTASVKLDDLISLNREIAALVRAGVPLELGLSGVTRRDGRRLNNLAERLRERLAAGWSLPAALKEEGPAISPVYASVIAAGLESGNLPDALESLANSGELIQESKRRFILAMLYPGLCLAFGYFLFVFLITMISPKIIGPYRDMIPTGRNMAIDALDFLHKHEDYIATYIPAVAGSFFLITWLFRGTFIGAPFWWIWSFRWVPGVGSIYRNLDWAQFSELLALQLSHRGVLPESMVRAADSTNLWRWKRESRQVANRLNGGASLSQSLDNCRSMPMLMAWMLSTADRQGSLIATLRVLAEIYRTNATRRSRLLKTWLPVLITLFVTGTIGLAYGLAFILPLRALFFGLTQE